MDRCVRAASRNGRFGLPAFLLLLVVALPARAAEVQEARWGFDGRVVPERINVLSLLLVNGSERAFDDLVTLQQAEGGGRARGVDYVERCYVAPFGSRWVQFYPYVADEHDEWVALLGKHKVEVPAPQLSPPAAVCLTDPDDPLQGRAALRTYPDVLFPTTVSATDGLRALVVDYAPRWEAARGRALLDWLRRGGTLHLLPGRDGEYPRFSRELAVLNAPDDRYRLGAGLVVRHRKRRDEVNDRFLEQAGFPAPTLRDERSMRFQSQDAGLLTYLGRLVRPEHNWPLIYVALAGYMVLVGPVNYLLGRRTRRPWRAVLFFAATVACFGWVTGSLGRRGFEEAASVHSLAYALPVSDEEYDVTQWVNVFVTDGDLYTLSHGSGRDLYASCQAYERVSGVVEAGANGRFVVDIPLFSSRPFLHRAKMKGHALGLAVAEWRQEQDLESLTLSVGPGFPEETVQMWALHGSSVYAVHQAGRQLRCDARGRARLERFLQENRVSLDPWGPDSDYGRKKPDPERLGRDLSRPLIARALGGAVSRSSYTSPTPPPDDEVHLFILAESPESFALHGKGLGREVGYVLYHVRLFRPENADG